MYAQTKTASTPTDQSSVANKENLVRFRLEGAAVQSISEMNRIAGDPANAGRTFHVTKEVFDHFSQKLHLLPGPPDVIPRINSLLGIDLSEDERCGMTGVCVCPHCAYELSFADHVESVVRMGLHSTEDLARLFTGDKYFLTVATEKGREMLCPKCDTKSFFPRFCYVSKMYAYAEVD
jgi:hypothetical protein